MIIALRRQRQEERAFKVILSYVASFRPVQTQGKGKGTEGRGKVERREKRILIQDPGSARIRQ